MNVSPMLLAVAVTSVLQEHMDLDLTAAHLVIVTKLEHVTTSAMNKLGSVPVSRMWLAELVTSADMDFGGSLSVVHVSVMVTQILVIHLLVLVSAVVTLPLEVSVRDVRLVTMVIQELVSGYHAGLACVLEDQPAKCSMQTLAPLTLAHKKCFAIADQGTQVATVTPVLKITMELPHNLVVPVSLVSAITTSIQMTQAAVMAQQESVSSACIIQKDLPVSIAKLDTTEMPHSRIAPVVYATSWVQT